MISIITLIFVVASVVADDPPPPPQTITVNITVKTEAGDPIENAPILTYVQAPPAFGFTDAEGKLTLQASLSENSEEVFASLHIGSSAELDIEQRILAEERYTELIGQYHFREYKSVPFTAAVAEASIEIIADEERRARAAEARQNRR